MPPLFPTTVFPDYSNHHSQKKPEPLWLNRPRHKHSGRRLHFNHTLPSFIPSFWSRYTLNHPVPHHNKACVNLSNLCPVPMSSQPFTKQHRLKLALLNTHSLNNKDLLLMEFITDNNLDLLCITETWHKPLDYFLLNQVTPQGFTYIEKARSDGREGGIAAIHRNNVKTIY